MTRGTAMARLFHLAADAVDAGGDYYQFIRMNQYLNKINLSNIETDGQLLAAIEDAEPKWTTLIKPKYDTKL